MTQRYVKSRLVATVAGGFCTLSGMLFGGCAANKSGTAQVQTRVMDQGAELALLNTAYNIGPNYASVGSRANDALTGLIADVISNNNERNNRYIDFLYLNADGTWRKDTVHALTGDMTVQSNYTPTQKELVYYTMQQQGTDVRVLYDSPGGAAQGFTDIDQILVRNKNTTPQMAFVLGYKPFNGEITSIRGATAEEIEQAQTRRKYSRVRAPHQITRVENYDPRQYARDQYRLHAANVQAGNPYPLASSYQGSEVNPGVSEIHRPASSVTPPPRQR